ncbi:MAG: 4-hydroxy-3-methylbut-2-enyl diphosphate reductase, partial [Sphingorhabdus sp.]
SMTLVETIDDALTVAMPDPENLSFLTQTTLSVDDTAEIVRILQRRFPSIIGPKGEDICYATSNRQEAVKAIASQCDLVLVIGAPNSSNSLRLVEVAARSGAVAHLVQRAEDISMNWFEGVNTLGLTAGASAPEVLVREIIDALAAHFELDEQQITTAEETITFKLPRELAGAAS